MRSFTVAPGQMSSQPASCSSPVTSVVVTVVALWIVAFWPAETTSDGIVFATNVTSAPFRSSTKPPFSAIPVAVPPE